VQNDRGRFGYDQICEQSLHGNGRIIVKRKKNKIPSPVVVHVDKKVNRHALIAVIVLVLIVTGVFSYTVKLRKPVFGTIATGHHQWLTASTVKYARYWYREGAFKLHFLMLENPRSVEFPTLQSRGAYPSYPPGTVIPIYLIGRVASVEPNPAMVEGYDLANHLLIALLLAMIVFRLFLTFGLHPLHALLFALIPALVELLTPGPLYFMQMVFFSDQAVILPFVLFVGIEIFRDAAMPPKYKRWLDMFQYLLLFWGFFIDWFFVFIALFAYIKRILLGELPAKKGFAGFLLESALYWAGPAIAVIFWAWQVWSTGTFNFLREKFLTRTGVQLPTGTGQEISHWYTNVYEYARNLYGPVSLYLLWGAIIVFAIVLVIWISRKPANKNDALFEKRLLVLTGLVLIPCFVHSIVLKGHSMHHDFSILKYAVPLGLVPFVLFPAWAVRRLWGAHPFFKVIGPGQISQGWLLTNMVMLLMAISYIHYALPLYPPLIPEPNREFNQYKRFFDRNFEYKDIVVSPNFEIAENPPQIISYTLKRCYLVHSPADVQKLVVGIHEDYRIRWIAKDSNGELQEITPPSGY
jgi:hypothetical protein